ncbi:glycosyltransferase [Marinilactibacillus piezotolerans]|uniref:glycosyltransferase n=1 Tax=Marinilactibacillus piezotolerans TaxID=258723 RepID=UPI0009AFA674|nr:glycosyltransferase [Marinilactibacillus piezotolerans]
MNAKNEANIKVLHIMSGFGGGISSFVKNKAQALSLSGIPFYVLTYDEVDNGFRKSIESTGGKIFLMKNPKTEGFKQFYKTVNETIKSLGKGLIIHSHIQGYRVLPFYLIAKKNRVERFIIHAHSGLLENEKNRVVNKSLNIEKISCGKKASISMFGKKAVEKKEIMHIPNSINVNAYFNNRIQNTFEPDFLQRIKGKIVIGHVGRFHPVKNHSFMIDLIQRLADLNISFVWLFIGDGALLTEVKAIIKEKGLDDYVLFLGRRNDLAELYKVMDYFVLPSFYEGLPTVAIEAQASGTQVLLSDSITEESDLGLNLVEFLSLANKDEWISKLSKPSDLKGLNSATIQNTLVDKKFTNEESARLYLEFLKKERSHYEI